MTIQEAIETIEYARAFNKENTPLMRALDMAIEALRAQPEHDGHALDAAARPAGGGNIMASIGTEIQGCKELRPCMADGKRAMFHKWVTVRTIVPPSIMKGGHLGGEVQNDFALVEYVDGTVAKVDVSEIRFLDGEKET